MSGYNFTKDDNLLAVSESAYIDHKIKPVVKKRFKYNFASKFLCKYILVVSVNVREPEVDILYPV